MNKEMLEKYAELVVKVGLNLQEGQRLFIMAEMDTAPLVRAVTARAYQEGSPYVMVLWEDEELKRIRQEFAPRDSFEEFPAWVMDGLLDDAKRGDAFLSVRGTDPDLYAPYDPEFVGIALKARAKLFRPAQEFISNGGVQWTVVCPPTPKWAAKIFPEVSKEEAVEKLWEVMVKLCRLDKDDPKRFWQNYLAELGKRHNYLTEKQFETLHFRGPGTDLKIGMPEKHIWKGGGGTSQGGVDFTANIPTEEVFSMPHKYKVDGTVHSTKPLNHYGNLIDNFSLTFEKGQVVDYSAEVGQEALKNILESDENAKRLGEVALVPHRSPISESGLIFYNTLYDENAACHLALGSAYRENVQGALEFSDEEMDAAGVNDSLIHVDFMIGSDKVDLDGITPDGKVIPLMRLGEWAFEV
jgi:aminopeptidase